MTAIVAAGCSFRFPTPTHAPFRPSPITSAPSPVLFPGFRVVEQRLQLGLMRSLAILTPSLPQLVKKKFRDEKSTRTRQQIVYVTVL